MKKTTLLLGIVLTIAFTSCNSKTDNTSSNSGQPTATSGVTNDSTATPPSQETVDELNKAVTEEHANPDITYKSYDPETNTVIMVEKVDGAQFDELKEYYKLVEEFKNSTKPADATIKSKGANIIVHCVNKANEKDTITDIPITPEDLK